jgi:Xaa-Pro dipeptidase
VLVPFGEIESRLGAVQSRLASDGIDAAVLTQTVDLFYLTGTAQQGHVILPADGEPTLLVRRDIARAREESPLHRIEPFESLDDIPSVLGSLGIPGAARIALELDVLPVTHYRRYERVLPTADVVDCGRLMREVRSVKSPWEIARMREAARLTEQALTAGAQQFRVGATEAEMAAAFAAELLRRGHAGVLRMRGLNQEMPLVHVFAGPEAGVPSGLDVPFAGTGHSPAVPQGPGSRPIGRGEAIVVDLGSSVDGYVVDTTRTFSIGPLEPQLLAAHDTCRAIRREILRAGVPGASTVGLYQRALRMAAEMGYGANFMGAEPNQVAFIGHGVGLEVDELPLLSRAGDRPLVPGNVIALEPKILLPGTGAVGIEDSCVVTETGLEPLTQIGDAVWEV